MKNLANCNVREFLTQTNKIRKSVSNWLSLTQILEIRKNNPVIPDDENTSSVCLVDPI